MATSRRNDDLVVRNSSSDEEKADGRTRRKRLHEQPLSSTFESFSTEKTFSYEPPVSSAVIPPEAKEIVRSSSKVYAKPSKLEEDISERLNGIRINSEPGSYAPPAEPVNGNPIVHFNKLDNTECLLHKLGKKDTLQGLAVKYGVDISEIKRVNKLWRNDDMFARKDLVIPTTMEAYMELQSGQTSPSGSNRASSNSTQRPSGASRLGQRDESIRKFMDIVRCDEDVARHYLDLKKFNFAKALGFYYTELENKTTAGVPVVPLDDLEIWTDDEARQRQMQRFDDLNHHAIRGPATISKVSQRVQSKLNRDEETLFDL